MAKKDRKMVRELGESVDLDCSFDEIERAIVAMRRDGWHGLSWEPMPYERDAYHYVRYRDRPESDEELAHRLANDEKAQAARRQTYLRLKSEFEPT